ncbi:hypothetical protein C3942_13350 [Solimonas fluminis]|uniref:Uncharacterized protein n=2 Tax=Solimonas fluminis TaxID=2086571 RepID=A0A2S5TE48_9GAMM|nr:hypothetical protein C3942_13350 [Solimonas fluminis]
MRQVSAVLDRVLHDAVAADKFLNSSFKLIVVLVHEFDQSAEQRVENAWESGITAVRQMRSCA